jgi:hypothetical protein
MRFLEPLSLVVLPLLVLASCGNDECCSKDGAGGDAHEGHDHSMETVAEDDYQTSGNYMGLATRWISIDTQFSREPRMVLDFKGSEALDEPLKISFEGFVFPVSEADMMRERLNAERQ